MASAAAPRRLELDLVRGLALFGILVVNLPFHALPMQVGAGTPPAGATLDRWAFGLDRALFEAKFYTLFALLFGLSLALQRASAAARGADWGLTIARRHTALAAIGLFHGIVLFLGDVLLPYALLGSLALVGLLLRPRVVLWIAAGLLAGSLFLSFVGGLLEGAPTPAPEAVAPFEGEVTLEALTASDDSDLAAIELRVYRHGPLWAALLVRGACYLLWLFTSTFFLGFNLRVLALMLLGIALAQLDILGPRWSTLRRKVLVAGLALGLPLECASAAFTLLAPEPGMLAHALNAVVHELGSLGLAAGLFAALVTWAQSDRLRALQRWLAAAGRMAFTNYLLQSLVANFLFTGLGLGLYGTLAHPALLVLAVALYAAQLLFSNLWLAYFSIGPFEWAWRAFTHWRWPAWRDAGLRS